MNIAVEARGLHKSFGRTAVLSGVDLAVPSGTVFALLGPNGAGKTTLINILSTLVRPDEGTATVSGYDVVENPQAVRGSIGLTGQSAAVDGVLTAEENLRMMGRLSGLSAAAARVRGTELLERFDLVDSARKGVTSFSGGMRRRLDLALSLIVAPPVLFLDEPTTGLDTRSRLALWDVIRDLRSHGTTIVLTTQYLEEADQLADRIAVLDRGVIVAEGTPADLKSRTGGEVVELRDREEQLVREIPTDGSIAGLRAAIDQLDASGLDGIVTLRKPTLDDVFLAITAPATTGKVRS
ncbi:daunorubicin resistance protein DrrA family ABC transporter ATP-binding protein [soil metagenome]